MQVATVWRVAPVVCALVLIAGFATAQTTSTQIKAFEVVSVDGNQVVLNGADGAREITVPDDFRFTVGGKQISVHELQPGMKGSATITTRTTVKPVYVTEVKQAEVVQVSGSSIIVRGAKGFQSFVEGDVDKRGIKIYKDGKPVSFAGLSKGDRLSATIVTEGTPQIITERDVQARLAETPAPSATSSAAPLPSTSTSSSAAAPTGSPSAGSSELTAAAPAAAPSAGSTELTAAAPAAATSAAEPEGSSSNLMVWGIVGAIVLIAAAIWGVKRRQGA